jgi:hypothetical protein
MRKIRRRRTNLIKQECVVAAIWEFARAEQHKPDDGCVATTLEDGTRASLKHVGDALAAIMETFGYDVLEVQ